MQYTFYDFLGNIGVAIIILTYILLQLQKIRSESLIYSMLNALGSGLIIFSLIFSFNLSAFIVEILWLVISLFGIANIIRKKVQ
ncbi:MAG TPA: hypothetical protein PKY82_13005 [Pyrinomonadaceae bacterium]|nr:hypothetical protein [Pyrinomonadaceae bacterium]